jgi:hypothetical protein
MKYLLALSLAIGVHLEQAAQETVTYGPWQGYWQQARLSAYSPHDALDAEYHATKGERWRWITADGRTDVRERPYGVAASSGIPFGTAIFIPTGYGYLDETLPAPHQRVLTVDDRGATLERSESASGRQALDLRYRTEYSALAFGVKDAWVFIITGDALPTPAPERREE